MANATLDKFINESTLTNKSYKKSKNFSYEIPIYYDVWMDNALENFYRILKNIDIEDFNVELTNDKIIFEFNDFESFKRALIQLIKHKYKNMIVRSEDKKIGVSKEIKKDFILLQEGKKEGGIVKLKEEIFNWEKLPKILDELKNIDKGNKICIMCGRRFKKSYTLKQAICPFVTKNRSFSGIKTIKTLQEYNKNLCLLCYLLGGLEWTDEGLIYYTSLNENKTFLFLPIFENLKNLNRFKEEILDTGILNVSKRYSNLLKMPFSDDVEKLHGEYTTLLAFYEKFILNAKESELLCNIWGVLHIPLGKVKNVKFEMITIDKGILNIISELIENDYLIYSEMINEIYFKKRSNGKLLTDFDISSEIKENLSKYLLMDDFRRFSRQIMPRKGGFVIISSEARRIFDELIYLWRLKNMGIPKEKLDIIKSVGNIIAKISLENSSLLYKLDKTRTIEEFWGVLREISRKMAGMEKEELREIKPTAIDELVVLVKENEKIWKEVRDLLVIYASMYMAIKKLKKD